MIKEDADFSDLIGKTIVKYDNYCDEELTFWTEEGDVYMLYHEKECCERVEIAEIIESLDDILDSPIVTAEVSQQRGDPDFNEILWTFYRIGTAYGNVCIRWLGESNGYYGMEVNFAKIIKF